MSVNDLRLLEAGGEEDSQPDPANKNLSEGTEEGYYGDLIFSVFGLDCNSLNSSWYKDMSMLSPARASISFVKLLTL